MKKIAFSVGIMGIITLCIILITINAQEPPPVLPFFDGLVIVDGEVPDAAGLSVTAYVEGDPNPRGSATIYTSGSDVRYSVEVSGEDGVDNGKIINFHVSSSNPSFSGNAPQTSTWELMKTELLDLIVGTSTGCSSGANCSECNGVGSGWQDAGNGCKVVDIDSNGYYDYACCDPSGGCSDTGIVNPITVYYS